MFDYETTSKSAIRALRAQFPQDTISTSEGWQGRVHVKIVSEQFNGLSETDKQERVWGILKQTMGPEVQGVSLALAYGTDEL